MAKIKKHPPLIQQFIENQKKFPDAIIATEVGGFFEIWELPDGSLGHARRLADKLDFVLTKRSKKDPNSPHMIGFPSHSAQGHFQRMVGLGETVVVVEQNKRGRKADNNKNITRTITKILSPGTVVENLKEEKSNYFASIFKKEGTSGLALIDVSTGEVRITEILSSDLEDYLKKITPSEILINEDLGISFKDNQLIHKVAKNNIIKNISQSGELLSKVYEIKNPTSNPSLSISNLGLEHWGTGVLALANLINYLTLAEYNSLLLKKLGNPEPINIQKNMIISSNGFLSLEVFESQGVFSEKHTLLGVLDNCKTAMGRRCLRKWLSEPSNDIDEIQARLDKVESYIDKTTYPELKKVYDIARLSRRMIFGRLLPHEIAHLHQSLKVCFSVLKKEGENPNSNIIKEIEKNIDVDKALVNEPFFKGSLEEKIKPIFDDWKDCESQLYELKTKYDRILQKNTRIVEKTDSFFLTAPKSCATEAKVLGLSFVSKASEIQIVDEEWASLSFLCFGKKQKYLLRSKKIWEDFQKSFLDKFGGDIIDIAKQVGEIDVLTNFAEIAVKNSYCKPKLLDESKILLENLRHPMVEDSRDIEEAFVPNTVCLGGSKDTMVIYGANSAGKSTVLKSVAVAVLMTQIGCYVPASKAELGVFNSIMTRMTTFDSLSEGFSTFTMEMKELQEALKHKDKKALFLFDEIGRGTSVKDGQAIAYATLAYLSQKENDALTLFATHYHDLVPELEKIKSIDIKHMECYADENGVLVFPRNLKDGEGTGSYGIEVASSLLPKNLITIAKRYNSEYNPLKISNYNSVVKGTTCPICKSNPVQETHHIVEQMSGKVKSYKSKGVEKSINDKSNLVMICATCHEKITRKEMEITRKIQTSTGIIFEVKNDKV